MSRAVLLGLKVGEKVISFSRARSRLTGCNGYLRSYKASARREPGRTTTRSIAGLLSLVATPVCLITLAEGEPVVDDFHGVLGGCRIRSLNEAYIFQDGKPLGQGHFGKVSTAVHKASGEVVAVKVVPRGMASETQFREEIETHREAGQHPNVIGLKEVYADDEYWYMVMELASGGELYDRLTMKEGMLGDQEVRGLVREVAAAVAHLHDRGIVHFDIKPENILLGQPGSATLCETTELGEEGKGGKSGLVDDETVCDEIVCEGVVSESSLGDGEGEECSCLGVVRRPSVGKVLLTDFGSSFRMNGNSGRQAQKDYTAAYSAPEVISSGVVDQKADVWSLGVIAYIMVKGTHPFDPTSQAGREEIEANVKQAKPDWEGVEPRAAALLCRMLALNPADRPTAREVLNSPWLQHVRQGE